MEIYTLEGDIIINNNKNEEGKKIFRKMTTNKKEINICKIIMENPHENIVKIYKIYEPENNFEDTSYIDMELLDTNLERINISIIREQMKYVKSFLQNLGIVYIDWKIDNIGIDSNEKLKLFDFDASGKINVITKEWEIEPPLYYNYRKALSFGMNIPFEIDDYAYQNL
jgi:serine/threonine protein kinase